MLNEKCIRSKYFQTQNLEGIMFLSENKRQFCKTISFEIEKVKIEI